MKSQRFVALFLLGGLLLNYPLLALFSRDGTVFGVPLLFAYIFVAWALCIVLAMLVTRSR